MFRKAALVAARLPTLSDSSNQSSCIGSIGIGAVTECAVQHCIVVWKAAVATAPLAAAPVGLGSVCRHLTGVV